MNKVQVFLSVYAVCRQAGDDHVQAIANAQNAVDLTKDFV